MTPERWSAARAEQKLRSLELFGMRFGLDRMRRMMTVLGSPERRYETIHVLGTNGKSSTTRMTAAILRRHGLRTAAYTSPHLLSYRERVLIDAQTGAGEQQLSDQQFGEAIERASWAAERVNRTLGEGDHVTQFELLTAAALWQMARSEVDVAVVEAGLGGRYDATSVIDAPITVLTNVGLEHTRWLGPTLTDIAEEKLAVVQPGGELVLGAGLAPEALAVARRVADERGARLTGPAPLPAGLQLRARGAFQLENFALATAAASANLLARGIAPQEQALLAAARETEIPGRLQTVSEDPLTVLDSAHNPHAVLALAPALQDVFAQRPFALVLGVLEDKDAASMLRTLLPLATRAWFTAPPSDRALSPAALQSQARRLGFPDTLCEPHPQRALEQAQAWARANGAGVLATGSVYLVGELLAQTAERATISPPGASAQGHRPPMTGDRQAR
ncbi:MAG: bifunctional folylpolyglutamate synthase/dihydrofolate synthase [Solirubrobacteraceae bacterium]